MSRRLSLHNTSLSNPPVFLTTGGHRSPACEVGVEVCYRNDAPEAPLIVSVTFASSGLTWPLELGNGWCSHVTLNSVPGAAALELRYSFPGTSSIATAYTLAAPGSADCVVQLPAPAVSPLGGPSLGPAVVTLTPSAPEQSVAYSLSGAQSTAGAALEYAAPLLISKVRSGGCGAATTVCHGRVRSAGYLGWARVPCAPTYPRPSNTPHTPLPACSAARRASPPSPRCPGLSTHRPRSRPSRSRSRRTRASRASASRPSTPRPQQAHRQRS